MESNTTEIESKVTTVTVYQGRAMVTRRAELDLKAGNHLLIFTDLSADIDRNSIQVKGSGEATLGECIFDTRYFVEDVDEKRRALLKEQEALEDALAELNLQLEAQEQEKAFVNKISTYVTTPNILTSGSGDLPVTAGKANLDADGWQQMLGFYTRQMADIDRRSLVAVQKTRQVRQEMEKIEAELDALGAGGRRAQNIIKVGIAKKTDGPLALDLSYIIYGPDWQPVYNLRASSEADTVAVEYDAMVVQATGENWDDVALKLSTARVNVSGVVPELQPWRLHSYAPAPMRMRKKAAGREAEMEEMEKVAAAPAMAAMPDDLPDEPLAYEQAAVETGGAAVVFSVAGGGSISGDNSETRVTIMRRELPAAFFYTTVPKLVQFAYLSAEVQNTTDYPFLPGRANVFFDGSFVATSQLELIMPDQKLDVSLGVDEGVEVKYRFIKRFKKSEGLMSKRTSEKFEYQIRVTNNRQKPVDIKVFDQFPIAQEKEISVRMIAPVVKEGTADLTLDDESRVQWRFELAPGEKRELPFSFAVEYPVDMTLSGLN